jgi:hypothetical protein
LVERYTDPKTANPNYLKYMKPEFKDELMEELGLKLTLYQTKMKNKKLFEERHHRAFTAKNSNKFRKGAKFKKPEENEELRIEDLQFLQKVKTGEVQNIESKELNKLEASRPTELPDSSVDDQAPSKGDVRSVDLMTIKDGMRKFEKF